jgi:hypothetical protein
VGVGVGVGAVSRSHPFWKLQHGSVMLDGAIGCDVLQASVSTAQANAGKVFTW